MALEPVYWPHAFPPDANALAYDCGWCDTRVSSVKGSYAMRNASTGPIVGALRFCPGCGRPTYFDGSAPTPAPSYGRAVGALPDKVGDLYREARHGIGAGAPHATVMVCRKLLMHVAVEKGAKPGESFAAYVQYLADNGYVSPGSTDWVDEIREIGNDANHEIFDITLDEAKAAVDFVAMMLQIVYEFPERGRQSVAARRAKDQSGA